MSNYKMSKKSDGSWDLMDGSRVLVRGGSYTEVSNLLSILERQEVGLTEAHEVADAVRMARNPSPTGGKMKSTKAGRNAVLDFLQSEGIQIVPVPHGDRKTGGQIVVMLGDGTWLEFDTQKQVVDWLGDHMERRGLKVHDRKLSKARSGIRSNPSKSRTTAKYPYVFGYRQLGTGYQGYARLGHKTAEITSARMDDPRDAAAWVERLLRERGVIMMVWSGEHVSETKMTQYGWESELRKGLVMSDLTAAGMRGHDSSPWGVDASRQRARRNPSSGKAFWWLIITRDDATAIGHRYESREDMVKYSKRHAANLRGDSSKALIRGTEPMTTADFRKAFKIAYPKFTLEV